MSTYADVEDVGSRIPYREITADSQPSTDDVQGWLDTAEARLVNTLASVGIAAPSTSSNGAKILADLITSYAEGHTRQAYAAAGGDGQNQDGKDLIQAFNDALKDIRANPGDWAAELAGTPTPGAGGRLRGPASGSNGDPMFTMADQEDQF